MSIASARSAPSLTAAIASTPERTDDARAGTEVFDGFETKRRGSWRRLARLRDDDGVRLDLRALRRDDA
jgi:hypothetical protein